jgi:hypothetical protein
VGDEIGLDGLTRRRATGQIARQATSLPNERNDEVSSTMARAKVSCDECFFRRHGLCALNEDEACATFRPFDPEHLKPPRQMRFVFRQERRTQSAWSFPSAQDQFTLRR